MKKSKKCPKGKVPYASKRIASSQKDEFNLVKGFEYIKDVYKCRDCKKWHLTTMTQTSVDRVNWKIQEKLELRNIEPNSVEMRLKYLTETKPERNKIRKQKHGYIPKSEKQTKSNRQ